MVMSSCFAGAEMITFLAPPLRWSAAWSRSVNRPVDSSTTSTPRSFHGSLAGSFSARTRIEPPATVSASDSGTTSPGKRPCTESYFSRCASVFVSVMSLTATKSRSLTPIARAARTTLRPIRPKPLMPTRIAMISPSLKKAPGAAPERLQLHRKSGPRERHRLDPRRTTGEERRAGFRERGSRREHVVYQNARRAGHAGCLERAGHVGLPRFGRKGGLGAGLFYPAQPVGSHRQRQLRTERGRDPLALIVSPFPQPPLPQRHRYQAYLPRQWLQRAHGLREPLGNAPPPFVLEPVHRLARRALQPDRA